jgi:dethiobiotin synthetase
MGTMTRGYFVTGTDTGVGKTRVSLALMARLQADGHVVTGMKPVASGCAQGPDGLVNADALQLQAQASFSVPYAVVNPYAFEAAVAPHLAARAAGVSIELEVIRRAFVRITESCDRVVVEGAGGWLVPISQALSMADVAVMLDLPVVLVVAIRLGCLNHALLTAQAIRNSGLPVAGWVANRIDPGCELQEELVADLDARLWLPCLGDLPCAPDGGSGQFEGKLS